MTNIAYFKDQFEDIAEPDSAIREITKTAFDTFNQLGLPTYKLEEWKYTNISSLFDKNYQFSKDNFQDKLSPSDLQALNLAGEEEAHALYFINGRFAAGLSKINATENELVVLPLQEAAKGPYQKIIAEHLGSSSKYLKDGLHALNTAFIQDGVFIYLPKGKQLALPLYLHHINHADTENVLSQPRSLVYLAENTNLQLIETYTTLGSMESFSNEVMEIVLQENAYLAYYKLQNDGPNAAQVSSTQIHQLGKSYVQTLTIALNGGVIRNNLNLILEAEGNETHLYGLSLLKGNSHVDHHTLVDNKRPNCFSNQLYKGIADDTATGVFSGRIIVQRDAQKTNAYQSSKNIILSDRATINAKPQLEILADDVKCSHGCTVGQLDEEAMFYLRARGIPLKEAESLLLRGFAADILDQIKLKPLRKHIEQLILAHLAST
ncbi:Fe-S cluster assembly protein SufD [Pedobacter gandavensis]|uniref:Fe-S cluster assembly protein SufD n=1 Tax=Pedobacter gandavensis TaxID=2679963 RepID=A0ABR6EWG2_9SPHI|nr:Fe-S cluster assembly protein SufD [Pedobacter gandavensis]MBB2149129.1 Fe-S cluster assembly protein SufD [Pedobacter gandavensis]